MEAQEIQLGDQVKFRFIREVREGTVVKKLKKNYLGIKHPTFRIFDGKTVFRVEVEDIISKV